MSLTAASVLIAHTCHGCSHWATPPPPPARSRAACSAGLLVREALGGRTCVYWGGGFPLWAAGDGGRFLILPCDVNSAAAPPPLPRTFPTWTRIASHATSTHSALHCSLPTTEASGMTMATVPDRPSPIPATPACTRQCPLASR